MSAPRITPNVRSNLIGADITMPFAYFSTEDMPVVLGTIDDSGTGCISAASTCSVDFFKDEVLMCSSEHFTH